LVCLPLVCVESDSVAEAWEEALELVWKLGVIRSSEDGGRTKAATSVIAINNPVIEVHRGDAVSFQALKDGYIDEVLRGTKDSNIGKGWDYTYHDRLFSNKQVESLVRRIGEFPETRRAQAVTWRAEQDSVSDNPPCLQRVWVSVFPEAAGSGSLLELHTDWRSRDLFNAWEANVCAMVALGGQIASSLPEALRPVVLGRYVEFTDDLHIYDKDFEGAARVLETSRARRAFTSRDVLSRA
jgi:thymidylate synthase